MTRMTKTQIDEIAERILARTPDPSRDIEAKAQREVADIAWAACPPGIQALRGDSESLRYLQAVTYAYGLGHRVNLGEMAPVAVWHNEDVKAGAQRAWAPVVEAQADRAKLDHKIRTQLASCSTLKQFRERFPELAEFAPEPGVVANLPATTDLMDSLKAAGFPQ